MQTERRALGEVRISQDNCRVMELAPRYASAIVTRWEEETGGKRRISGA